MNKRYLFYLSIYILSSFSIIFSQTLSVQNPSFEGVPNPGIVPVPWVPCMPGQSPDTQPAWFGVTLAPSDGATYLGLVDDAMGWQEGASQQLINENTGIPEPMQAGENYQFTIDLSGDQADMFNDAVELLVWGGFGDCPQNELLWSSGDVPDFIWTTYNVSFTPTQNFSYIMFQVNAINSLGTYILIDNMSNIELACPDPESDAGDDIILTCENFTNLSANEPTNDPIGGIMSGSWTILSGYGEFSSISDPNATITNIEPGENIFEWTLVNDCGVSSDQIIVNYTNNEYNFTVPSQVYCLSSFEILSSVEGTWIVDDPLNMEIANPNNSNTFATPNAYGIYNFSFESCGEIVFNQEVNILGALPIITGETTSYCLEEVSLNVVNIIGDPGYWDYEGPGNAIFNNILSLNPSVSVDTYGVYQFTYYGCGMSNTISVEFIPETPDIDLVPTITCSYEATLTANSSNPIGWSLVDSPLNSTVIFSNPESLTTNIEVSEYGDYQFMFEGCGTFNTVNVVFESTPPVLISPEHTDCLLEAYLYAYTDESTDFGPWTQINGPAIANIENPLSTQTLLTVPEYGIYEFEFEGCDTYSTIEVGFSCDPLIPNVFTPNGDGNNDFFVIDNLTTGNYSETLLTIYNRWGEIIFMAIDYGLNSDWWDGKTMFNSKPYSGISADRDIEANQLKNVSDGVYYYVFDVFNIPNDQKESFVGYITIIK